MVVIRVFNLNLSDQDVAELTHYSSWLVAAIVGGYTLTDIAEIFRTKIEVSSVVEDVEALAKKIIGVIKETITDLPVTEEAILKRLEEL